MLTAERNELLTRFGRGTPVGELFRRYWLPVLLGEELPEPDCAPVRLKLLGERLVAFRDTQGRIGLIEEFCAHRGVSLWFGRNEEGGIRCPYHGWKYDVTGQCIDLPSEPEESGMRKNIKLNSYPAIELAGVIWAYLGPADKKPQEPAYDWTLAPPGNRHISKRLQECNYLQAMEGALDSIHSGFLHRYSVAEDPLLKRDPESLAMLLGDRKPKIFPENSPAGLYIATRRDVGRDRYYWRVTQWLMPCFSFFPPYGGNPYGGHAFVPIDDEHCWTFSIDYHYLIDRAAQKAKKSFSGIRGVGVQDAAIQESMGPIQDRTREHLVSSDNGIVKTRRRLMDAASAVARGADPPGLDPEAQRARAVSMVASRELSLREAIAREQRSQAETVSSA